MFNRPRGPRAPHRYPSLLSPQTGGNPVPRVARLAIQLAEARKLDYLDDTVLRFSIFFGTFCLLVWRRSCPKLDGGSTPCHALGCRGVLKAAQTNGHSRPEPDPCNATLPDGGRRWVCLAEAGTAENGGRAGPHKVQLRSQLGLSPPWLPV